jgi:hypothetical protein
MKKYAYSYDREDYRGSFDTPEEAVAEAVREADGLACPPTEIYVGTIVEADPQATDHAERIVEAMNRRAHVDYGDAAERYLKKLTKAQVADLDKAIERAILDWLARHALTPTFVKVQGIREYPVPYPGFATASEPEASEVGEIGVDRLPSDVS